MMSLMIFMPVAPVILEVHLHEGFLHVLDMGCRVLNEPFPVTEVRPEGRNMFIRTKARLQEPKLMELLEPLRIVVVSLSSRHLLYLVGVSRE
jgi:hypothetical protein